MHVKENRARPGDAGAACPSSAGTDASLEALPLASVVERHPVLRLARGREPVVAAERLVVSWRAVAAALGVAATGDVDLLRHAVDRIAERLFGSAVGGGAAAGPLGGLPERVPVLLPLPLRPVAVPAPRPGLVGVLPLAAAAGPGLPLAARQAGLAALGWRLGIDELDAAALRFVAPGALSADLLVLRWSPDLEGRRDALRGADPQRLVLAGCGGPDALAWGQEAGLSLFSGPGAEAAMRAGAEGRP